MKTLKVLLMCFVFTIGYNNSIWAQCQDDATAAIVSAPANGSYYEDGEVINICYRVTGYDDGGTAEDWFHGVQVDLPAAGFDLGSVVSTSVPANEVADYYGVGLDSDYDGQLTYSWVYESPDMASTGAAGVANQDFGWYVDVASDGTVTGSCGETPSATPLATAAGDGNPHNGFGLPSTSSNVQNACPFVVGGTTQDYNVVGTPAESWEFCFDITASCVGGDCATNPPGDISFFVQGDGTTGDWTSATCTDPGTSISFLGFVPPLTCVNTGGTFLDPGGAGNYGDNLNESYTICPDNAGDYVVLDFTTVALENCCDVLSVYDGNTTSAVLNADLEAPATFTSADPSGCISVTFTSDINTNDTGWEATVTCVTPPFGYWVNGSPALADGWATCQDVVIKDPTGYAYDSGGPLGNAMNPEHNVVSICPDGAATVSVTIDYNMEGGALDVFDGPSRNNSQDGSTDAEVNLTGQGTYSFTTSGPCFSYYSAQFGGAGYSVNWSVNTAGAGFTLPTGDLCESPYIIDGTITNSMSSIDATSGPVYNAGVIVEGGGCEPDLITDGCTATIENTIYAQFTACNTAGDVTVALSNSACTPGTQTPQFFVYEGSCGALSFVGCESSAGAGTTLTNTFTPTLGATYYVVIDGFRGNECTWDLDVTGCIETCTPSAGTITTP